MLSLRPPLLRITDRPPLLLITDQPPLISASVSQILTDASSRVEDEYGHSSLVRALCSCLGIDEKTFVKRMMDVLNQESHLLIINKIIGIDMNITQYRTELITFLSLTFKWQKEEIEGMKAFSNSYYHVLFASSLMPHCSILSSYLFGIVFPRRLFSVSTVFQGRMAIFRNIPLKKNGAREDGEEVLLLHNSLYFCLHRFSSAESVITAKIPNAIKDNPLMIDTNASRIDEEKKKTILLEQKEKRKLLKKQKTAEALDIARKERERVQEELSRKRAIERQKNNEYSMRKKIADEQHRQLGIIREKAAKKENGAKMEANRLRNIKQKEMQAKLLLMQQEVHLMSEKKEEARVESKKREDAERQFSMLRELEFLMKQAEDKELQSKLDKDNAMLEKKKKKKKNKAIYENRKEKRGEALKNEQKEKAESKEKSGDAYGSFVQRGGPPRGKERGGREEEGRGGGEEEDARTKEMKEKNKGDIDEETQPPFQSIPPVAKSSIMAELESYLSSMSLCPQLLPGMPSHSQVLQKIVERLPHSFLQSLATSALLRIPFHQPVPPLDLGTLFWISLISSQYESQWRRHSSPPPQHPSQSTQISGYQLWISQCQETQLTLQKQLYSLAQQQHNPIHIAPPRTLLPGAAGITVTAASLLQISSFTGLPLWVEYQLHAELLKLQQWCIAHAHFRRMQQLRVVCDLAKLAQETMQGTPHGVQVSLFGSFSTGLATPSSDVDVLIKVIPTNANGDSSTISNAIADQERNRNFPLLAQHIRERSWARSVHAIATAHVPVIKVVAEPLLFEPLPLGQPHSPTNPLPNSIGGGGGGEEEGGGGVSQAGTTSVSSPPSSMHRYMRNGWFDPTTPIHLDITFDSVSHRGDLTTSFSRKLLLQTPALAPLTIAFKLLLSIHDLNDASTGGLSSYGVLLMTHVFLQNKIVEGAACISASNGNRVGLPSAVSYLVTNRDGKSIPPYIARHPSSGIQPDSFYELAHLYAHQTAELCGSLAALAGSPLPIAMPLLPPEGLSSSPKNVILRGRSVPQQQQPQGPQLQKLPKPQQPQQPMQTSSSSSSSSLNSQNIGDTHGDTRGLSSSGRSSSNEKINVEGGVDASLLCSPVLGHYFLRLLKFYSDEFSSPQTTSINSEHGMFIPISIGSIRNAEGGGEIRTALADGFVDPLNIPDPSDTNHNVGKNCYKWNQVQGVYRDTLMEISEYAIDNPPDMDRLEAIASLINESTLNGLSGMKPDLSEGGTEGAAEFPLLELIIPSLRITSVSKAFSPTPVSTSVTAAAAKVPNGRGVQVNLESLFEKAAERKIQSQLMKTPSGTPGRAHIGSIPSTVSRPSVKSTKSSKDEKTQVAKNLNTV